MSLFTVNKVDTLQTIARRKMLEVVGKKTQPRKYWEFVLNKLTDIFEAADPIENGVYIGELVAILELGEILEFLKDIAVDYESLVEDILNRTGWNFDLEDTESED